MSERETIPGYRRRFGRSKRRAGRRRGWRVERYSHKRGSRSSARTALRHDRRAAPIPQLRFALALLFMLSIGTGSLLAARLLDQSPDGFASNTTLIRSISVQGNHRLSAESVAAATAIAKDSRFDEIDVAAIEERLLAHPWIQHANALPLPTGRLLLRIEEREPRAALRTHRQGANTEEWRWVDASGTPFAPAPLDQIEGQPQMRGGRSLATGVADPQLAEAVSLAEQLASRDADLWEKTGQRTLELPNEKHRLGWVLHSDTPPRRIILGERDLEQRLQRLELLFEQGVAVKGGVDEIDLRFAKRAVLRSGSSSGGRGQ